jgi:hypothetical protein
MVKKVRSSWFLMGRVCVDSGQLMVGDPCYLGKWNNNEYVPSKPSLGMSYNSACHASSGERLCGIIGNELVILRGVGQALCFSSGHGDGVYEIWGKKKDGVISEVKIKMS